MLRRVALVAALATATVVPPTAAGEPDAPRGLQRVTLDRVETEASLLPGLVRLRLFVSAIDLGTVGSVLTIAGKKTWELDGAGGLKRTPYVAGAYEGADAETAVVFVLQTSGEYEPDLEAFKAAIRDKLLAGLPPATQVALIGYGDTLTTGKLGTVKKATDQLERLTADPSPASDPKLLQAVDRAVKLLRRAKPLIEGREPHEIRKLVVVVSDGRDGQDDPERVSRLGQQADRAQVRIHTVAYSPDDHRRPLLALGELSKRSQGTFRWVQRKVDQGSLEVPFVRLSEELRRQHVLTLFVPPEELPRKLAVSTTFSDKRLVSNDAKVPAPLCGEQECAASQYCAAGRCVRRAADEGRGLVGWLLLIGGGLAAALAALVAVGVVITRLRQRRGATPASVAPPAGAPPAPQPAASVAPAAPAAPVPPAATPGACLYVMSGPQAGQRLPLRHGFTIGKAPGCDLSLAHDGYGSTHHAQIVVDAAGGCVLVDRGSTNGTFVNGVRITEQRLFDGMAIRCGSTDLRFLQQ